MDERVRRNRDTGIGMMTGLFTYLISFALSIIITPSLTPNSGFFSMFVRSILNAATKPFWLYLQWIIQSLSNRGIDSLWLSHFLGSGTYITPFVWSLMGAVFMRRLGIRRGCIALLIVEGIVISITTIFFFLLAFVANFD